MTEKTGMRPEAFLASKSSRSLTWVDLLDLAEGPEKVVAIAKDFLATWDPWEIAGLPLDCRPPGYFVAPEDIVSYAFTLARFDRQPGEDHPGVRRMTHFFSPAAQRIAILMSAAPGPSAGNDPSA